MKRISTTVCASVFSLVAFTQNAPIRPKANVSPGKKETFDSQIIFTDANGRPFKNLLADVKGSPNFLDHWNYASLKTSSNVYYDSVKVLLDLYKQELHFLTGDIEMVASPRYIATVVINDSSTGRYYKFQSGFPAIDNQNENNFYQVLSEGSILLLKSTRKIISESKDEISGLVEKRFETYEDYYAFDGTMTRIKKEKEFVLKILGKQKAAVDDYLKSNKVNFKNIQDLIKLFDFYNSLGTNSF